jgi:glycosyltransferase involved in cell wall biosynthesis
MRIIFFVNHFLPSIGGVQWSVLRTAEALAARGHDLVLITETPAGDEWSDGGLPFRVVRFRVPLRRPLTRLWYWRWMWSQRTLLRSADVLHFHDYTPFLHWFLPLRPLIRGPRYAVTFHGFEHWPVRFRHRVFRSITAAGCDVRFAVGAYLRKLYRHPIDAVYLGAPVRRFERTTHGEEHVFAYAGRLSSDTGILPLLSSLAASAERTGTHVRIRIAGDGPLRGALAALRGPRCGVELLGVCEDPRSMLASAGCIIATGFLGILEACTSGAPVIVPAYTEVKKEYVASFPQAAVMLTVLADEEASGAFFDALLAGRNREELEAKARRASAFASQQTWDDIALLFEDWYVEHDRNVVRATSQEQIATMRQRDDAC